MRAFDGRSVGHLSHDDYTPASKRGEEDAAGETHRGDEGALVMLGRTCPRLVYT